MAVRLTPSEAFSGRVAFPAAASTPDAAVELAQAAGRCRTVTATAFPDAEDACPTVGSDAASAERLPRRATATASPTAVDNCPATFNNDRVTPTLTGSATPATRAARTTTTTVDGKPALDDSCPTVYGTLANGCPAPPPPPPPDRDGDGRIDARDACPDRVRDRRTTAARSRRSPRCRPRVKKAFGDRDGLDEPCGDGEDHRRAEEGRPLGPGDEQDASRRSGTELSLTVKRLKRGAHRVKVSISSSGGAGTARTKSFRVR